MSTNTVRPRCFARSRIAPGALALALAFGAQQGAAQTPQEVQRAQQEQLRLQLEQQQREQQRRRELEERLRTPRGEDLRPPPVPAPQKPDERCFEIREVRLEGVTKLSDAEQAELTRPYTGRCVGLGQVNELIQKVTNLYVSRGFTTTRAYVPEQDLRSGVLRILVLEGLVEKILLEGEGVSLATAFPDLEGKVFNLRDFEQGIDQVNRLRSNSATLDIEPGAAPGASVVKIRNAPAKPWAFGISLDNTGSDASGLYQGTASLGWDNPLGLNDFVNVSWRQNPDAEPDRKLTVAHSLYYAVPYGSWLFSATASRFESASTVQGGVISFLSSSESVTQGVRADRMMLRDQFLKLTLATGLTLKDNRAFLNRELISVSSRKLTVLDGGASLAVNAWGGLWSFDAGFAQGLDAAGALTDAPGLPDIAPRAQFFKWTFGASFNRPLRLAGHMLSLQSSVTGQHSRDVLYGTEQILIGGPFSVRGFRDTAVSGDSGFYWRNELGLPLPLQQVFGEAAPPGVLRPYVGYDVGRVFDKHGVPGGTLAGTTIGLHLAAAPLSLQLGYSRPHRASARLAPTADEDRYTYVRIALDF
ncbi:MAG TPA: ShlB/FhaC/HecB family hemolysin secretion/activation protein [Burkholderiales bacterium]|nr:ShlB/FhaC/HecB family hemolysin secretion/activation protein [Burkholderiales bacterium]